MRIAKIRHAHLRLNLDTGIAAEYAFDVMDRRTEINWVDAATNTLRGFTMAYNNASMITNITEETGEYRVYGYDSIDRLVSERHYDSANGLTFSGSYEYDLAGNRTKTVIGGVTNTYTLATGDRLASWGTNAENTVSYDTAGSVTQIAQSGKPALNLTWDLQYRLTSVSTNGTPVEIYQYDATGRRIATSGTNVVRHVYDGMHVIADTDASGNVLRSYVWGPGIDNLLALTVHGSTSTNTFQALTDHLGTVHALVDENGDAVETYKYDAWGNILGVFDSNGDPLTSDLGLPTSGIGNRFLFQGREYSFATGLYNFRTRWYDPITGRWMSNDPIGISGGLNQYVFCANNPINFVDPLGQVDGAVAAPGQYLYPLAKGQYGMPNAELVRDLLKVHPDIMNNIRKNWDGKGPEVGFDIVYDPEGAGYDLEQWPPHPDNDIHQVTTDKPVPKGAKGSGHSHPGVDGKSDNIGPSPVDWTAGDCYRARKPRFVVDPEFIWTYGYENGKKVLLAHALRHGL